MSEIRTEDDAIALPTMTIRMFLLGMLAMNVLNGLILIFFLCFGAVLLLMFGAKGSSIGLELILAVIGVSLLAGVGQIGKWFFHWLFSSSTKRVLVSAFLLAWYILLAVTFMADYVGPVIAGSVFVFAMWDMIVRRLEVS
jgi:hypothetical protein